MHPNHNLDSLRTADFDFLYQSQQPQQQQDGFGNTTMSGDLDMFANTQFFDFDMSEMQEHSPIFADDTFGVNDGNDNAVEDQTPSDSHNNNFNYSNFPRYAGSHVNVNGLHANKQYNRQNSVNRLSNQTISNNTSNGSSPAATEPLYLPSSNTNSTAHDSNKNASKDAAQQLVQHLLDHPDDAARVAAEEDKRRRNTAASARFRIKKKQREQALEKSAKEMSDRVAELEGRVSQLEMENKILKDLITEKSGKEVDMEEVKRKVTEATPEAPSPKPSVEGKREKPLKEIKVEKASLR